jgi:hypothetical protein
MFDNDKRSNAPNFMRFTRKITGRIAEYKQRGHFIVSVDFVN